MTNPTTIKKAVAELQLDDDQSGNHLGANAMNKTTDGREQFNNWHARAEIRLAELAASGEPFTAADVRTPAVGEPDKPGKWGTLFLHAQRDGLIVSTGFKRSSRASRHGTAVRVWVGTHGEDVAA